MNFTTKIKNQIMEETMSKTDIEHFINGVLFCSFKNEKENISIQIKNNVFLEFIKSLLIKYKKNFEVQNNTVIIKDNNFQKINPRSANKYFAGMFFVAGSMSNLDSSSYHLQINLKNEELANEIIEFSKKHIIFSKTKNKNKFVIYIKKNESISDFLHIIGAKNSYFEFIDSVISRDLKNQVTRIFNLDVHNQQKMVNSHQNFLENLKLINDNKLQFHFSKDQLVFFEFKKNNQFLPLSELAIELNNQKKIKKTKGGLNHWLIKLRNVCEEFENDEQKKLKK